MCALNMEVLEKLIQKLLKSVGFYNMPWKALKDFNKMFNKIPLIG